MTRAIALLLTSVILLQACDPIKDGPSTAVPVPVAGVELNSCNAVGLQGLVGQPVKLIPKVGAWSSLRIIRPGQAVTMDYSATRLNARVGPAGKIQSLTCG